jgi:hypothetical protein
VAVGCDPWLAPTRDASIVTPESVLGFSLGAQDITVAQSDDLQKALANDTADLAARGLAVTSAVLGKSVDERDIRWSVVGRSEWASADGLAQLERNLAAIRDPATPPQVAADLVERTPSVLWVAGNVHGNEESGTDASLKVLYDLASRTDCAATQILDESVVFVLPTQNPDGREADTRRNVLGFDMNRDWFARTQPETDAKIELLRQYPPQVFIDDHEMGSKTFFFPPNSDPVYHEVGEAPISWVYDVYGPAMQRAFDASKTKYFNGSTYDLFYMGYGDTVPAAGFNAAGMTFEKSNGDKASVRVKEQFTAIWATLSAAAGQQNGLLGGWRGEFVKAAADGAAGVVEPNQRYYPKDGPISVLVPSRLVRSYALRRDPSGAHDDELASVVRRLQRMDVTVYRVDRPLTLQGFKPYGRASQASVTLQPGDYWIPLAQGQKHWIHAMLHEDPYVPFPYFYDVTAWSLPLLGDLDGGSASYGPTTSAALAAGTVSVAAPVGAAATRPAPLPTVPRIALWEVGTASGTAFESSGWLREYLTDRLGLAKGTQWREVTGSEIASGSLAGTTDVLLVSDGSEKTALNLLGSKGKKALAQWVRGGGTMVALRESARLASTLGLTTATWAAATSDVPGALVRATVLSGALDDATGPDVNLMYEYDDVWTAPSAYSAVAYPAFGSPDWFVSGFADGIAELGSTTAVVDERSTATGLGRVVLFASDPNYRAFAEGSQELLRSVLARAGAAGPVSAAKVKSASVPASLDTATARSAPSYRDSMVVSVAASSRKAAEAILSSYGASWTVVKTKRAVTLVVDLGGLVGDEHPWARSAAADLEALGTGAVLSLRVP